MSKKNNSEFSASLEEVLNSISLCKRILVGILIVADQETDFDGEKLNMEFVREKLVDVHSSIKEIYDHFSSVIEQEEKGEQVD